MKNNHQPTEAKVVEMSSRRPQRRQVTLMATLTVVLFVVVPFLFWRGTWFGRTLTDQEISERLSNNKKPREIQHALSQITDRIGQGDSSVRIWYPELVRLGDHSVPEIRINAAWAMGQDNKSQEFQAALLRMITDSEPLVRRNAALQLVRFGDASGRTETLSMLHPYTVVSPRDGTLTYRLENGNPVDAGTFLARIEDGRGEPFELRSPLPGHMRRKLLPDGTNVKAGDGVAVISPGADHVWEALRALYLIGQPEDIPEITPFRAARPDYPARIREQAQLTIEAIQRTAGRTP